MTSGGSRANLFEASCSRVTEPADEVARVHIVSEPFDAKAPIVDSKLTRNQRLVLSELHDAGKPLSAYRILDRLQGLGLRRLCRSIGPLISSLGSGMFIGLKV